MLDMPFEIVRNDITTMQVDAIVNTANPNPIVGTGTDTMVHAKAGPKLLAARKKIGAIPRGGAAITPAFDLQARYVIHTVGPVWQDGNRGEADILRSCYERSLALALKKGCESVAFPLISSGNYGFPKDKALQIAIAAFSAFLLEHEMQIYLVVFDRTAYQLSEKLFHSVASYIDEHFVQVCEAAVAEGNRKWKRPQTPEPLEKCCRRMEAEVMAMPCSAKSDLADMLKREDAGFTETLLRLIDESGKKDSEIYKKALLSKQHFSKIRNNPGYKPTKATALSLALALELDLDDTKDLIGRAGYALTNSSKFDLIIQYHIENKKYNIVEINTVLYEFDQTLLGA